MREEPVFEALRAHPTGAYDARFCSRAAALGLKTLIAFSLTGLTVDLATGAELPIPCGTGTCGSTGPTAWVTAGSATATATASSLTIDQLSERLVLNWQQFNIGPDGEVKFRQPDSSAVALNKIFQGDPVRILGALQANGSVYLVNQNGILFGPNARVDVGGLIASTLDLTPDAVNGLLDAAKKGAPAFRAFADNAGSSASGDVRVEAGARVTADGGQLFLFGSNVTNAGTLNAPGGQVIFAAGDSVYLAGSQDSNLRGLLVEVGRGGVATNSGPGVASAPRGNVTLAGLMVNQEGRASATTSVRENGSVRLLARDGGQIITTGTKATNGGTLRLGAGSLTSVDFQHNADDKTVDATPQARSFVELEGRTVSLEPRSQVIALSGRVQITAREDGTEVAAFAAAPGQGRVVVAPDAKIDVSGAQIERSVDTNILRVELRGSQLADSPQQREGPLRGQPAFVDIRRSGTRADGTSWVGSPIGDLAGDVATIQKTVEERSLLGGRVQIAATGAVLLESGSTIDVSGGGIAFSGGLVKTSQLVGTDGRVYDIGDADRDRPYVGLTDALTVDHKKWGVTERFQMFWPTQGVYEPGYREGKDAGSVSITAPRAALDGAIRGEANAGLHQRTLPGAVPANALYRSVTELPLSGNLTLGTALATGGGGFLVPGVQIASGSGLGDLQGPTGGRFNPLLDPLPNELATVRVRPDLFGADGLGALTVYANGGVTLGQSSTLNLSNVGQLNVTAGFVDIEGRVLAPSGSVSLTAQPTISVLPGEGRVGLGTAASIDVAGRWINDAPTPTGVAQHDPLVINGGSVALGAKGGAKLELLAGSRIDLSAGAHRLATGAITAGLGGALSISAAPFAGLPVPIRLESQLSAYAFKDGGRLSLTLNAVCLADTDCSDPAAGRYRVDLGRLALDGFETVSLASNLGGIDVVPGTRLQPRQHNYLWAIEPTWLPSGTPLSSVTTVALLPDELRHPFDLGLAARPQLGDGGAILSAQYAELGVLSIGTGAVVDLDVGASLTLQSSTGILVDGSLRAAAGRILLDVTRDQQLQEFVASQGIWLGDHAALNVAGSVQALADDFGLLRGSVLDGGSITLRAERGYVATAQHSVLDASGTAADLVVGQTSAGSSGLPTRVASNGGSIEIAAAEGLLLNGGLYASAGEGSTARGGSLGVTLDGNLHGAGSGAAAIFPFVPRELHVVDGRAPAVIGAGQALPVDFYGRGLLPVDRVANGGFDSIALTATNQFDAQNPVGANFPVSTGSIQFDGSTTLQAHASLRLNAPRLVGAPGGDVTLSAAYVGLGYDDIAQNAQTGGDAAPGSSRLTVNAGLIDLIGTLGLDGFGTTRLGSSGDIRLRGVEPSSTDGSALPMGGLLHSRGSVDFTAQQVYATTLADYRILLEGPDHNLISVHTSPGTPGAVLSAGGRITLTADEISQGGVLRAPLGELVLHAQEVTLANGSVTSTSANGAVIPFGTLQVGADWTYQLPRGQTALFSASGPPAQRLELNAQNVVVAPGATLDLSGGGALLGYELVPGVTGTKDVLGNDFVAGQFAIVPTLGLRFAPFDPATQVGFGYRVGDTVHLSGYGHLPAGEYAVLPARYALLPGGYLVRPVAGYTDIRPAEPVQRLDGSVVISGSHGVAGTAIRDSRTSGFALYDGDAIARQARYRLTRADDFFSARATATGAAPPRLPRDAGQLQLIATARLDLEGLLSAAIGSGGRGSRVDVSASRLRVVAEGTASSNPGEVTIRASQLGALGAESLLLGGLRHTTQTGTQIETTANDLTVAGAVTLDAPTLTLVARNQLAIESGATLQASGAAAGAAAALSLSGDGALVRVSTAPQSPLARTGASGVGGTLLIGSGARISSKGSALLEATGTVASKASYDLAGGSLGFSVARLGFGNVDATYPGVALSAKELSSLNLSELSLTSATGIDFFRTTPVAPTDDGSTTLRVNGVLALTAQSLNIHDVPAVTIGAHRLVVSGTGAAVSAAAAGKLILDAPELVWGGGSLATVGVDSVTLSATNQFRAEQSGVLSGADIKLLTPEIVTGNGVDFALRASGSLEILGTGQGLGSAGAAGGVGGSLSLEGGRVTLGTKLSMPSGLVKMKANAADASGTPSLSLTDGATIDVSGFKRLFDGQIASGGGGLVRMESGLGGIALAAGSLVDVSAGTGQGDAGRLDLRAPSGAIAVDGALRGNSAAGASGEILVDGYSIPDVGSLSHRLNDVGFGRSRAFRQRGPGDLIVATGADSQVRATHVDIAAEGGSVIVFGGIDASGPNAGTIRLAARDNVDVYGFLLADASVARAEGGRIDLSTDAGGILLRGGASVSVAGGVNGTGGLVSVRAPQQSLLSVLDADPARHRVSLAGRISGNRELAVEGYRRYTVANGIIDATYTGAVAGNALYADAAGFMQLADPLAAALANGAAPTVVAPGIELQSSQGLTLAADWNLATWRFAGRPGVLTLRAGGDLSIQRSLSDGFAAVAGAGAFEIPDLATRSWSYRLVAGADLNSSDVLAVKTAGTNAGVGKLTVAGGQISTATAAPVPVMVRTGTGSIDLAAASDLVLTNRASVIYTAGASSGAGVPLPALGLSLAKYPTAGGDISVTVGGSVVGAPTNQLVTGWLWRAGRRQGIFGPSATGWNVNFQRFEQGIGALAGGNVTVRADGDIRDFSASVASIGRQVGGTTAAGSVVQEIGGGNLVVESGGNITGGSYYDGKGKASLRSWGAIGINTAPGAPSGLAPTLVLGDTVFDVVSRRDLTLEAAVNPFLLPQSAAQGGGLSAVSYFSSYSARSALHTVSTGGTRLINSPSRAGGLIDTLRSSLPRNPLIAGFADYPGTLDVVSLAGNMSIDGPVVMWPSAIGDLRVFANGNLNLAPGVSLPDVDPATLPTIASPAGDLVSLGTLTRPALAGTSHVPIHSAAFRVDGHDDPEPVRIVATGDIVGATFAYVAKPLRLIAGGDVLDLAANIENIGDGNLSLISAQGNIRYRTPRHPLFGYIVDNTIGVQVEGPGQLALEARGSIDLGSSLGVTSAGNFLNPALPATGVNVSFLAGATATAAHLDAFEQRYLAQGALYDEPLARFVENRGGPVGATKAVYLAALGQMTADARYQLAQIVLLKEMRAGGRVGAGVGPDHGNYTRAFEAIETLFPGSTASTGTGSAYAGDISLFFSRVYTLDGGDIAFVAPGGAVNVGLATPPAAFGVTKGASELGIVAQRKGEVASVSYGDFQVNESRVFAADGGNILVWSTQGDIDAGRGAKTAIAAPPPTITFNAAGNPVANFPAALTGSGIQALSTSEGTKAGAVDLFAPRGVVNAGDAGIVAGDLTIGATAVLGTDNISVSGVSVGVPVDTGGFGAALTGASAVGAGATNAAEETVAQSRQEQTSSTPLADQALGFLDVFVTGFGEPCDPAKEDCRNTQQ